MVEAERKGRLLDMQAEAERIAVKPPVEPPRDLAHLRPVIRSSVTNQERQATQIVGATWNLFSDAIKNSGNVELQQAVKNSSLATLMG